MTTRTPQPRDRIDGVLLLDKPLGLSSNDALMRARRLLAARKAGHGGTLDPLATGLLPLLFGEATKFAFDSLDADKTYRAEVRLGVATDTGDAEGRVLAEREPVTDEAALRRALAAFVGEIEQVPPMHSALKRGGRPLYALAREGVVVERAPRRVTIFAIDVLRFVPPTVALRLRCSKGTYVRSLAIDLGERLGCGAHLSALRRERVGALDVADAVALDALEALEPAQRRARLLPVDALLRGLPIVDLDEPLAARFAQGQKLRLQRPDADGGVARRVRVYGAGRLLGVALDDGGELRPQRLVAADASRGAPNRNEPMTLAIRNIAIIAHVDHGKTTLVDQLLRQSGTFRTNQAVAERVMDSDDIERERGITILAKNCAVEYDGTRINIVDTPGHADFGGEVERALSMVDGVLLLVDAVEGPMPQTRFVTRKALALGLEPIVVVNKVDRPGARPHRVVDETFDLFDQLGASEKQLDFPVVYASAINGFALERLEDLPPGGVRSPAEATASGLSMKPLFEAILRQVPVRDDDPEGPLQFQISALDWSSYVGKIGIGRIGRGRVRSGQNVVVLHGDPQAGGVAPISARIGQVLRFQGLERVAVPEAEAGDIVAITGIEAIDIGSTVCDPDAAEALPTLQVDEPTMSMEFLVNDSPLAGREGRFVTSRQIRERLERELKSNVALRVDFGADTDTFVVSGRGELHLTILLENMRREGYELAVSRPKPKLRIVGDERQEPYERLTMDVEDAHQGAVMELLGRRRGEVLAMQPDGGGRVRLDYRVPARGLIGFQNEFMNLTRGTGIAAHVFDAYGTWAGEIEDRRNGVLVSQDDGEAVAYALWKLQERGRMFVSPGERLYEGMIIGIHSRDNDLVVNPVREKKLTNIRAAGKDEHIALTPPIRLTLEKAVEFIAEDELVELTPKSIRLRKRHLKEHERRRAARASEPA